MTSTCSKEENGILYVVATPIGNLGDISLRAIQILKEVVCIAAEDTRHSLRLLRHYAIETPMIALHMHNEMRQTKQLLSRLLEGDSIALITDAGTPCIHDPGCVLVAEAHQVKIKVVPIPGPCAISSALSVAGLPTQPFFFQGFLPAKREARQKQLQALASHPETLILYEAPHRILHSLEDMSNYLGQTRLVCVARELTKSFETLYRGSLQSVYQTLSSHPEQCRGEFVILVSGQAREKQDTLNPETGEILETLLGYMPVREAVQLLNQLTAVSKKTLYQGALAFKNRKS